MVFFDKVPLSKVKEVEGSYVTMLKAQHKSTLDTIASGKWNSDIINILEKEVKNLTRSYK
jgi:F0F1-type ATP synthase alpha subunit